MNYALLDSIQRTGAVFCDNRATAENRALYDLKTQGVVCFEQMDAHLWRVYLNTVGWATWETWRRQEREDW